MVITVIMRIFFLGGGGLWKLVVISGHFQMPRAIKKKRDYTVG